ncbi:MAG TPA: rhodanese-related sulfurtransferase, partial [Cyclobacteriaceae bacterium]|nr:rhodanese-related sulfurtransferase [Cyclobacteriaceae bacterium]
ILNDPESRITLSFYRYTPVNNPHSLRDHLFSVLDQIEVLGRIYIATEGINGQVSVPENNINSFRERLQEIRFLDNIRLNRSFDDNGKSFFKLKVKVRNKIVADGLEDYSFDVMKSGEHLDAEKLNKLIESGNPVIMDMRNHYESRIGHFQDALLPDANTFREALKIGEQMLNSYRQRPIVLYCTGGIRCEKASAYFKHKGFREVYQLDGGIIQYAREVREKNLTNYFRGKNFVFDERLGERISDDVIALCYHCGNPSDDYTNCKNTGCNLLHITCRECREKMEGCCSEECRDIIHLSREEQKILRKGKDKGIRIFTKGIPFGK